MLIVLDIRIRAGTWNGERRSDEVRQTGQHIELAALVHDEPVDPILDAVALDQGEQVASPLGGDDVRVAAAEIIRPLDPAQARAQMLGVRRLGILRVPVLEAQECEVLVGARPAQPARPGRPGLLV